MNWIDLAILGFFFLSTLLGFSRGLVREVVSLTALILAFFIATSFSAQLASHFSGSSGTENTASSYVAQSISFIILFVGTILLGTIIGYFLNLIFQAGILGLGNRLLGAVFGLIRAFLLVLVIIFLVQLSPLDENPTWESSRLVKAYQPVVVWLNKLVAPYISKVQEKVGGSMETFGSLFQDSSKREDAAN